MFPWNNFLHSIVYDIIAKIFNTFTFTANVVPQDTYIKPWHLKLNKVREIVKKLIVSVFKGGQLLAKIIDAQALNDFERYFKFDVARNHTVSD